MQENRIEHFKNNGDQPFTEDGRNAEITVDLVLHARAELNPDMVNGPEDAIVTEMIKQLPSEKFLHCRTIAKCFQERFMGQMEPPSSWKIVMLVFLRKPAAASPECDQKLQGNNTAIGDVEVVCILYYSSLV